MNNLPFMLVLCFLFCGDLFAREINAAFLDEQITSLEQEQDTTGAFYPRNCLNKAMTKLCYRDKSLFFTGLIAESLGEVNAPALKAKAFEYLANQFKLQDGKIRYYEPSAKLYPIIKPDIDDNGIVLSLLMDHPNLTDQNIISARIKELFQNSVITQKFKNKGKRKETFQGDYLSTWEKPTRPFFNDVDLVVNFNGLLAFAKHNQRVSAQKKINIASVCSTVNRIMSLASEENFEELVSIRHWTRRQKNNYSQWYPSKYAVMLALVRAHIEGADESCLLSSYQLVRTHLLTQKIEGNVYDKALALVALARVLQHEGLSKERLKDGIAELSQLIEKKHFGKNPFFFYGAIGYTGSIALLKALLIEATQIFLSPERIPASKDLAGMQFMDQILSEQMEDGSFTALIIPSSPLYNIFVVMMYEYLGMSEQKKEISKALMEHVFSMQKSSGALAGYPEGPDHPGITTAGYIAGKIAGFPDEDLRMKKMEIRIKELGGAMKSDMLTIPFMMMFSLFPIHSTFNSNLDRFLMSFNESMPWVKVLLNPVLFILDNGHNMILPESKYPAKIFKQPYEKYAKRKMTSKKQPDDKFIDWAMENMNPDGTFFDYTPTTVPMLMALSKYPNHLSTVQKGVETIESFQMRTESGHLLQTPGEASIGETFYMANVLLDVGVDHKHPTIREAERYLLEHQLKSGGWGFSKNSIHFADSDDTSNAMYFLIRLDHLRGRKIRKEVFTALDWLLTLQNKDGGFGTWEATKGGFLGELLNRLANRKGLVMSESVFEHTARIVVCLSFLRKHSQEVNEAYERAYSWLLSQQKKDGSFAGTWFINYMFSTSMAMTALSTDPVAGEKAILKGIAYLKRQQSPDGGFGESPDSFLEKKAVSLNQSSWAQTGLIIAQLHTMDALTSCKFHQEMKSITDTSYLYLRDESNAWTKSMDLTWTAVTFPKVEYLIYPYIQRMAPWQAYNMHLNSKCR